MGTSLKMSEDTASLTQRRNELLAVNEGQRTDAQWDDLAVVEQEMSRLGMRFRDGEVDAGDRPDTEPRFPHRIAIAALGFIGTYDEAKKGRFVSWEAMAKAFGRRSGMDHAACHSLEKAGFVALLDDGVVVLEGTLLNLKRRARGEKRRPNKRRNRSDAQPSTEL